MNGEQRCHYLSPSPIALHAPSNFSSSICTLLSSLVPFILFQLVSKLARVILIPLLRYTDRNRACFHAFTTWNGSFRSSPWTISRSFERCSLRTNESLCWQQRRELYGSLRGRHVCIARIVSVACREKKKRRRWWKSRLYRICGYHRMQLAWDEIFTGEFTRCFIYVSKREGLSPFSRIFASDESIFTRYPSNKSKSSVGLKWIIVRKRTLLGLELSIESKFLSTCQSWYREIHFDEISKHRTMRAFFFDKMLDMCPVNKHSNIASTRLSHTLSSCFVRLLFWSFVYTKRKGRL